MYNDYFFIKCVFRWSEKSVRFGNLMGIGFQNGQILWQVWHVYERQCGSRSAGFIRTHKIQFVLVVACAFIRSNMVII